MTWFVWAVESDYWNKSPERDTEGARTTDRENIQTERKAPERLEACVLRRTSCVSGKTKGTGGTIRESNVHGSRRVVAKCLARTRSITCIEWNSLPSCTNWKRRQQHRHPNQYKGSVLLLQLIKTYRSQLYCMTSLIYFKFSQIQQFLPPIRMLYNKIYPCTQKGRCQSPKVPQWKGKFARNAEDISNWLPTFAFTTNHL